MYCQQGYGKRWQSYRILSSSAWRGYFLPRFCIAERIVLLRSTWLLFNVGETKRGERLRASGGLIYTTMRELFLHRIAKLGFDPKKYGLHSLRAGGATAAANAGVPDSLFKCHGRWKSESAKDGYVKDSVDSLLSVSKRLKLRPVLCDLMSIVTTVCEVHSEDEEEDDDLSAASTSSRSPSPTAKRKTTPLRKHEKLEKNESVINSP